MKHLSVFPDTFYQNGFHKRVDILRILRYLQFPFFYIGKNRRERRDNLLCFPFLDYAIAAQHLSVYHASFNVFLVHLLVERDGGIEAFSCL